MAVISELKNVSCPANAGERKYCLRTYRNVRTDSAILIEKDRHRGAARAKGGTRLKLRIEQDR
jgi:hypothetical protein